MIYYLQFILALPLAAAGIGGFVWGLLNPGTIGLVRLSLFAFATQFCVGPLMNVFSHEVEVTSAPADILYAWATIYLFYLAVAIVAILWSGKLESILIVRPKGPSQEKGIFACLTDASLRVSIPAMIGFYLLVTLVRGVVLVQYGYGLSGSGSVENTLALPYTVLALYKTFTSLGLSFTYVAVTKLIYKRPGRFWCVLLIVVELLHTFIRGRRRLFGVAILMFFAVLMKHGRMKVRHAVLASFMLLALLKIVFPMFYNMRHEWMGKPDARVSEWIHEAWLTTRTGGEYAEADTVYRKSFSGRLNALVENYSLANMLNAGTPPAHGQFLKSAIIFAIPRVFFPAKISILNFDDDLLNELFPSGAGDLVSNLPAFAMADFGILGGLIYGALYGLSLRFVGLMLKVLFRRSPIGAVALFSSVAFEFVLQVEIPPGCFAVTLRLALSIFLFAYAWSSIFGGASQMPDPQDAESPYPVMR